MWPFRYRTVLTEGLRARTGSWAVTRGVFRIERIVDAGLRDEPPEVVRLVLLHEEAHAVQKHGLVSVLLFLARPVLLPVLEAAADRYAARRMGRKAFQDAMRRVMPHARTWREAWMHGPTWKHRCARAGAA